MHQLIQYFTRRILLTSVCENCGSGDVEYCDNNDEEEYCSDCFLELNPEYVKFHNIKKISEKIKDWGRYGVK